MISTRGEGYQRIGENSAITFNFLMSLAGGLLMGYVVSKGDAFWTYSSGLAGIIAAASRIWWARLTERRVQPASALAVQSAFTVVAMALLLAATTIHGSMMWVMSLLAGFTMMSWNAVAMLAVIIGVPVALAGRASGIVMLGFMSGLSIGGLVAGYVYEQTGSFSVIWVSFAVCAAGATVLALTMRRRRPPVI